jgi:HSP20 family molecular chaperone IbpA
MIHVKSDLKTLLNNFNEIIEEENSLYSVNVINYENKYLLQLKAIGYNKDQFSINVVDNILVIKAEPLKNDDDFYIRNWKICPIDIKFNLNYLKNINKKTLSANLVNGILEISIEKTDVEKFKVDIN